MILLDTDVVIDIERRHPPAIAWLQSSHSEDAALPGIVALELLFGARNDIEAAGPAISSSDFGCAGRRVQTRNERCGG